MRSENKTDSSHILPQPPKIWNSSSLPWTTSTPFVGLMEFNAQQSYNKALHPHKRKSDNIPPLLPTKQLITEDKMAAHLNSLHISPDFIAHNTNISTQRKEEPVAGPSSATSNDFDSMEDSADFVYPMTNKELQEKLKRANRIEICNEIKKFQEDDSIIPKALLDRFHYQRPCTALVIWQPPQKFGLIDRSIEEENYQNQYNKSDSDESDSNVMNNNMTSLDLNNYSMDTDL